MPRTTKQEKLPQAQLKRFKMNIVHTKVFKLRPRTRPRSRLMQPSQANILPNMFIPYIEDPKMDWTVNDDLYHRFLKWCLKCENILESELAMLPEKGNARK